MTSITHCSNVCISKEMIVAYGSLMFAFLGIDCGDPGAPVNGDRELSATVFGSRVVYTCSPGYVLIGDDVRVCQRDATWSGDLPTCARKCN